MSTPVKCRMFAYADFRDCKKNNKDKAWINFVPVIENGRVLQGIGVIGYFYGKDAKNEFRKNLGLRKDFPLKYKWKIIK